jgi:3-dehydroquinate synthase
MVGLPVYKQITIKSHKGDYSVIFERGGLEQLKSNPIKNAIYIIDEKVARLYAEQLTNIFNTDKVIKVEAKEENKSLNKLPEYVEQLVHLEVRRGQPLVAIGGGIIQDITCFLAATMMRGLPWIFYPTTLLAQSDSCIGSKSSINSGKIKNILGTFTPPEHVVIDVDFLHTLERKEIYSGVGEMIKVHAIDSPVSFDKISNAYEKIVENYDVMEGFIHRSLLMKKRLIEIDEFDTGPRNIMNYGHSFGHAIETATNYAIPHGIAVTIGMDIANYFSAVSGISTKSHFDRMHAVLDKNCYKYRHVNIDTELLISALKKDKKNSTTQLRLILPNKSGNISMDLYDNNESLSNTINEYFSIYGRPTIV